jgi:hypothetical protein
MVKIALADKIRKLADLIERDNTPFDGAINDRTMLVVDDKENIDPGIGCKKVVKIKKVDIPELTPTAPPEQRRPRKQPSQMNKWNEDTKSGLMKEYMQGYRADGKDKEVEGPKSTYKKKF